MDRFNSLLEPLWVFLHRGHIVRRVVLGVAVWMTVDAYQWSKEYGLTESPSEWLVLAMLGTASTLLAASIKFYNEGRAARPIQKDL